MNISSLSKLLAVYIGGAAMVAQIGVVVVVLIAPYSWRKALVVFACVTAVAIIVAVAYWIGARLGRDLLPLFDAASDIAAGRKGAKIELNRDDEIGQLAEAFNRAMAQDKATEQANTDALTGLANRRHFTDRLNQELKKKKKLSVMFIDLDGFKPVNDTYGHEAGDEALKMVSDRLNTCVRDNDVLARIGGDEFVMMFTGLIDRNVLKTRADKVLELLNEPYWIGDNRIKMGGSIGISVAPDDGEDAATVLNASDEAMYAAKQGGKNAYRFYS